jgi:hypothetical protein
MPQKTIYIKKSDLPLWEKVQEKLGPGVSMSAFFAGCLRSFVQQGEPVFLRVMMSSPLEKHLADKEKTITFDTLLEAVEACRAWDARLNRSIAGMGKKNYAKTGN